MAEEKRKVKMLRRSRATGGALLLPGKTYPVSISDFRNLVRSGKGEDPTGEIRVRAKMDPMHGKRTDEEAEGGTGESTQTVGSSSEKTKPPRKGKPEDKPEKPEK